MPFSTFQSISDVATAYNIHCVEEAFVTPLPVAIKDSFRREWDFTLREVDFNNSEFSVCENLIYPALREVWKPYTDTLMLRGHEPLKYDEMLYGVPDYVVTRRSPLGKVVRGKPYVLLVVEAKNDQFVEGWGQCLAALLAAQRLNNGDDLTLYGVVSNGRAWEFGKLAGAQFTHDTRIFLYQDLEGLFAAINALLAQCRAYVVQHPVAA